MASVGWVTVSDLRSTACTGAHVTVDQVDSDPLLILARRLASEAGAFLLTGWRQPRTSVETKSSTTDMVSEMDRGAETMIVQGILAQRPNDAILGEEGTEREGTTGVRWIIDPLDGTTSYLYGLAAWCVSIGVERDGEGYVGVVDVPVTSEQYWARKNAGAWRGGSPVRCTNAEALSHSLIGTGFSYSAERRAQQGVTAARLLPEIRDIRRSGSAAADLCSVASGQLDGYWESGCYPWDLAAGTLICREAGALVSDLLGGEPSIAMCVAAPPSIHAALIDRLSEMNAQGPS